MSITARASVTPFRGNRTQATTCHNTRTHDLSLVKDFGERFSTSLHALNVANRTVELDNSQTCGGFHWNNPREIYAEISYRFRY